ncbi:MAG: dihydrofolate reductase family protein [Candidatus Nitrosocosmicus sp.]
MGEYRTRKGDIKDEIAKLKSQEGGDIIVYGGASFDSSLIKEKLIDEFYLFVNPIMLGSEKTIFNEKRSKNLH